MNILLIGSGGREHALAWRLAKSPLCTRLFTAPGNPGTARHGTNRPDLTITDHAAVAAFCAAESIGLVVVGPEAPLVAGLVDDLKIAGIRTFGPTRDAARLEGSKGFTKDLCRANGIPTAAYVRVERRADALAALDGFAVPVVIKADGLAAGKGVVIAADEAEARAALEDMLVAHRFGYVLRLGGRGLRSGRVRGGLRLLGLFGSGLIRHVLDVRDPFRGVRRLGRRRARARRLRLVVVPAAAGGHHAEHRRREQRRGPAAYLVLPHRAPPFDPVLIAKACSGSQLARTRRPCRSCTSLESRSRFWLTTVSPPPASGSTW